VPAAADDDDDGDNDDDKGSYDQGCSQKAVWGITFFRRHRDGFRHHIMGIIGCRPAIAQRSAKNYNP